MALYYLHEQESPKGSNRGFEVDKFNRFCKLLEVPWCATSQSTWADLGKVIFPRIKSGRARDFARGKTWTINDIIYHRYTPKIGDYRVKTRRGGHHVDVFLTWDAQQKSGYVIGGNVSDKVSIRKVTLSSMIADGTTHITEVQGYFDYTLPDNEFSRWLEQFGNVRIRTPTK